MPAIDTLLEDSDLPSDQKFACYSFVSPEGIKNCTMRAFKFRGAYATYEEAKARADCLAKSDPNFNVFVGECGKWLPWDPSLESKQAGDSHYHDERLQQLIDGYTANTKKAAQQEAERKREMLDENVRREGDKTNARERLKRKYKEKQDRLEKEEREREKEEGPRSAPVQQAQPVQKQDPESASQIKAEVDRLTSNQALIAQSTENIMSVDDKINKLQQKYKQMTSKKYE